MTASLDIYFIGTEVPRGVDNAGMTIHCPVSTTTTTTTTIAKATVPVTINVYFKRGLYQDVADDSVPNIVVGCNAGLAAYPEWLPALQHMHQRSTAGNNNANADGHRGKVEHQLCLFTDYNEEAAERAAHMCRHVFINQNSNQNVSEVQINPVLQPFLITLDDNALPTFSNGFQFWVCLA